MPSTLNTLCLSDNVILEEILNDDLSHFDVFVDRYAGRLISYFSSRILDRHIAEDLSQESLMRVFRAAKNGNYSQQGESAAGWIFTIAHRCLIDYIRSRKQPMVLSISGSQDTADGCIDTTCIQSANSPDPRETAELRERRAAVIQLLEKIPEEQREVVRLKIYAGLTFQQISDLLNCPLTTVKSRMQYGLSKIHQLVTSDSSIDI